MSTLLAPSIHDIVPAIRVGDDVVRGQKGDAHKDILQRFVGMFPDRACEALMDFDTPENPNFFITSDGDELSRADLKSLFGVVDSQGLRALEKGAL